MSKKILMALSLSFALPALAEAPLSLKVGPTVDVYRDASDPDMRCLYCMSFRALLSDRSARVGPTFISKVVVIARQPQADDPSQYETLATKDLSGFLPLDRTMGSPARSPVATFELHPRAMSEVVFDVIALRRKCLAPTEGCNEMVVVAEAQLKASDILALRKVNAAEIIGRD